MLKSTALLCLCWISAEAIRFGTPITSIHRSPHSVYVIDPQQNIIGTATLISIRWSLSLQSILTRDPQYIMVGQANSSNIIAEELYGVSKQITHPNFNPEIPNKNVIAMLKTERDIIFSDSVQPIRLGIGLRIPGDVPASVCSWGNDGIQTKSFFSELRCATFVTLAPSDCVATLQTFQTAMTLYNPFVVCLNGFSQSEMFCEGDSGAAVVSGDLLIGLVTVDSDEDRCLTNRHLPNLALRIEPYVAWILKVIDEE